VEEVNKLVSGGMPFRDAYKKIGFDIESGKFTYNTSVHHTHEGSIGDLSTQAIKTNMQQVVSSFPFEKVEKAIKKLLAD
jgi:argininosuccinate lyase